MQKRFKVFHLIIFFIIILLSIILFYLIIKFLHEKKTYEPYKKIQKSQANVVINGDYLTYVTLGEKYIEPGATVYLNGKKTSNKVITTYYDNGEQVFSIDTKYDGDYLVEYRYGKNIATRAVIVCDRKIPEFNSVETKTITDLETVIYDVNEGVTAYDNSGKVDVLCDNSLGSLPGNYVISCKAVDVFKNINTKKRLIKVIPGIKFNYRDNLEITFPKGENYIYKYSLDSGKTFIDCNQTTKIDVNEGSVIAAVYLNGELLMSNTYYIN
ncbi:MAG: hypothetical protein IKG27_02915 [Bacilli bacterium]|nr:hypothetical protein [Bacilli bacterium]